LLSTIKTKLLLTLVLVVVGPLILFYSILKKLDDWRESQPIGETFIVYGGPCLEGWLRIGRYGDRHGCNMMYL